MKLYSYLCVWAYESSGSIAAENFYHMCCIYVCACQSAPGYASWGSFEQQMPIHIFHTGMVFQLKTKIPNLTAKFNKVV